MLTKRKRFAILVLKMGRDTNKAGQTEVVIGSSRGLVTVSGGGSGSGHMRRLRPTKRIWRTVLLTVVVSVVAVGLGLLAQRIVTRHHSGESTVSGLPKQIDDVQNLRLNGDTKAADKKIDEGLSDPSTPPAVKQQLYMQKAYSASEANDLKEVADSYAKAVEINPDPQIYLLLGQTYFQMGDKAKARAAYVKGLELLEAHNQPGGLKNDLQQRIDIIDGKIDPTKE